MLVDVTRPPTHNYSTRRYKKKSFITSTLGSACVATNGAAGQVSLKSRSEPGCAVTRRWKPLTVDLSSLNQASELFISIAANEVGQMDAQ